MSSIHSSVQHAGCPQAGQHQPVQHHHNHVLPAAGACYTSHRGSQVHTLCHEGHGHCQHHRNYQEDLASWPLLPFLPTGEACTCVVCSVLKCDIHHDYCMVIRLLKKRKERTTPFGINAMRSQVFYQAAQKDP